MKFYLLRSLRRIIQKKYVKGIPLVYNDRIDSSNESNVSSHEDYLIEEEVNTEKSNKLHKVLNTLSKRQRECLMLKFEHNLSYVEISEIMEISVESARTIIYRALKELRKYFEDKGKPIQLLFFLTRNPRP